MAQSRITRLLPSIGLIAKLAIGALLFYVIGRYVNIAEAMTRIGKADPWLFLSGTGLILFQHIFAAARWQAVARAIGHRLPLASALVGYLESNFFNQALPSTVGGDAVRAWRAARRGMGLGPAVVSVFVDRALGLLVLALLAAFGAAQLYRSSDGRQAGMTLFAIIGVVLIGAVTGAVLSTLLPRLKDFPLTRPLYWLSDGVARVARSPSLALAALGHSLVGHLITVLAFDQLAGSLGVPLGLSVALAALPAILLASAVPISISGWGVREGVGVTILTLLGLDSASALALALLLGLSLLSIGLMGGVVWLLTGNDGVAPPGKDGHDAGTTQ